MGLPAEEAGPSSGESLGTARRFTHIGLVNATCAIDRAERRNAA
ncbi:hypothetical protein [Actinoallomurus rhizosphaericola]|nr:hypothetical protein [Actinoallomurus rhizosphaericola]